MSTQRTAWAQRFVDARILTVADVYAVSAVSDRYGEADATVLLALAFAVRAPRVGHAGVNLANLQEKVTRGAVPAVADVLEMNDDGSAPDDGDAAAAEAAADLPWPDPAGWTSRVEHSAMVGGVAQAAHPFVIQRLGGERLLLTRRMYQEQVRVAQAIRARAASDVPESARIPGLESLIGALFEDPASEGANAVRLAEQKRLAIIVGGPGIGKTFSICRLLAALLSSAVAAHAPVIKLAAPTGKAAARMREAIREATADDATSPLNVTSQVRAALRGLEATTLHKLIGMRPDGTCRHSQQAPMVADIVVVDEVSMVDLAMMRRVLEAVPVSARLVLLGDRDQLASVEAGCVLSDLVAGAMAGPLKSCVQSFGVSQRFKTARSIGQIAACLQSHQSAFEGIPSDPDDRQALAIEVLTKRSRGADHARITWLGPASREASGRAARASGEQLEALARPYIEGFDADASDLPPRLPGYAALLRGAFEGTGQPPTSPLLHAELLAALDHYRVLAVHRRGPLGVAGLEQSISARIRGYLAKATGDRGGIQWIGRPVLITENAYDLQLMNGDVGLIVPTLVGDRAVFPGDQRGEVRTVALTRLPPHQGALVMTVHKSQGSQFDRVAVVLAGRTSTVQTRELIYTAITRAKKRVDWLGDEGELREALATPVARASGLEPLLAGDG